MLALTLRLKRLHRLLSPALTASDIEALRAELGQMLGLLGAEPDAPAAEPTRAAAEAAPAANRAGARSVR
jgi:hypothetical protein